MLSIERQEIIINLIKEQRKITILALSKILKVSLNTVRADVAVLEKDGIIIRVHGGIALPLSNITATNNNIGIRYLKNLNEKRQIAKQVIQKLSEYTECSLFMDSSTSTMEVAELLVQSDKHCTVITHFSNIARILGVKPHISVIFCGGNWWANENCTIGIDTINTISKYRADIALIGCTGIHIDTGIFNGIVETVPIKQEMIRNSKETWLLCDSSKFDKESLLKIADYTKIHKIFTDQEPSKAWLKHFTNYSIDSIFL